MAIRDKTELWREANIQPNLNEKLRAWWFHRQGLDGSQASATPAEVLERTGWPRSVGGVGPYLTLFARAGTSREDADRAVANLEIHELPSARGCTYVVPASEFALALKAGEGFSSGEMKTAYKLGVTDQEVDKLSTAGLKALAKGPLDPEEIREATGNTSRHLGEEGKKKGMITTLPLALGKLQVSGDIRRVPVMGVNTFRDRATRAQEKIDRAKNQTENGKTSEDIVKSVNHLFGELKDFKDKVKPDEIRGEMTGLRTTMEKVLHPPRATMLFTFAPYPDPVLPGGPVIPLRDITLPLNPEGSAFLLEAPTRSF